MNKFYMVYAEGGNTPAFKYETYEDAHKEACRLSDKLGVKCYVLDVSTEITPNKPIEVKQRKPCKCYWYKITGDETKDEALKSKLIDLMPDTLNCYIPTKDRFKKGMIAFNYYNHINIEADIDRTFSQIVKMFGTELRIKEE